MGEQGLSHTVFGGGKGVDVHSIHFHAPKALSNDLRVGDACHRAVQYLSVLRSCR